MSVAASFVAARFDAAGFVTVSTTCSTFGSQFGAAKSRFPKIFFNTPTAFPFFKFVGFFGFAAIANLLPKRTETVGVTPQPIPGRRPLDSQQRLCRRVVQSLCA